MFADEDIELHWRVTRIEPKERLSGWVVRLEGGARSARGALLEANGTLLLRLTQKEVAS